MNIVERLRSRSPYLDGSSAERVMEEAADSIERQGDRLVEITTELLESEAEIERLRRQYAISEGLNQAKTDQIERLRLTPEQAYLQIVEGWLRDNRGIHFPEGAVDDLCERIARRALEPKP